MFNKFILSNRLLLYLLCSLVVVSQATAEQGYIIYCPCMGRFGNQAEQLLGTLLFAKVLDRTLVLPPFINYGANHTPELIPFENIIQVEPIKEYHDVVLLTDFMRHNATEIWPDGERKFYCYSARDSKFNRCDALKGQPYQNFWTRFGVIEDSSSFYKPLSTTYQQADKWRSKYPTSSHRVLAFVGPPSPFPAPEEAVKLQKYIKISDAIADRAAQFRKRENFLGKPYISMHIRHGSDWKRACRLLESESGLVQLFSSEQCTGYITEGISQQKLDYETCLPSYKTISRKLNDSLAFYRSERNSDIHYVHIATDDSNSDTWVSLKEDFPRVDFIFIPRDNDMASTMLDIYLMAFADVFIGNCISSFSAFPARLRYQQPELEAMTFYFGFSSNRTANRYVREEL